jgi:hypothetical protein
MITDQQPVYRVTLRARPGRVPPAKRLAQLLKHALRRLRLVCVEAIELKADPPPGAAQQAERGTQR